MINSKGGEKREGKGEEEYYIDINGRGVARRRKRGWIVYEGGIYCCSS